MIGALVVFLSGCGQSDLPLRRALSKYDRFILHTNADSIASMYCDAGVLGEVGSKMVVSRDSIRIVLNSFSHIKVLQTSSTPEEIILSKDSARINGTFQQTAIVNRDTLHAHEKFFSQWMLVDGQWKIKRMPTQSK